MVICGHLPPTSMLIVYVMLNAGLPVYTGAKHMLPSYTQRRKQ